MVIAVAALIALGFINDRWPDTPFTDAANLIIWIWLSWRFIRWVIARAKRSDSDRIAIITTRLNQGSQHPEDAISVFQRLRIKYVDGQGRITSREIHTRLYDPDRGHVIAHCMLKNEERTFKIDRIKEAIAMDTGEAVTSTLRSYLRKNRFRR